MTKEILGSPTSGICGGCNIPFAFLDYHWPHCPGNPNNLRGATKKASKSELATIAATGPVADKPMHGRRKGRRDSLQGAT